MRSTIVRIFALVCLLSLSAASCRDGYVETADGYYYDAPNKQSYLELSDALYKNCHILVDGQRPSLWGNQRTKVTPGNHEVQCDTPSASHKNVEVRAGKILHLDNLW